MYNDDDFNEEEVENNNQNTSQNKILEFYEANKKLIWILGGVIIFILVFSILLGGGGSGNTNTPDNEMKLEIDRKSGKITIGNTIKLNASVMNDDNEVVTNAIIKWSSSDTSIATVDSNGLVKGIGYGVATITVTYTDANNKPYQNGCEVVVAKGDPNLKITSVEFPEGDLMMSVGAEYALAPSFKPENGYITDIEYTSYNKDVVEVDRNTGLVKALKAGKATITLDVNDGQFEDEINVNVIEESIISQIVINPTQINFIEKTLPVEINDTVQLEYDFLPSDATYDAFKWESSDPTVASVDQSGNVKGLKLGTTEITVTALNGKNAIMEVNVIPQYISVSSIEILNEKNVTLSVGGTHTIVKDVLPGNASNRNVTFASSNSSVATVDDDGQVRAVSAGSATITVTSVDGNKTANVYVTVKASSSGNTGTSNPGSSNPGSSGSSIGTLSYKAKNGSTATIYIDTAKSRTYELPITISINSTPITKVDICAAKCESNSECKKATCTKKTYTSFPFELEVPNEGNGLYVIKATKYNNSYSETVMDNYFYVTGSTAGNTGTKKCFKCPNDYRWDYSSNIPSSICTEVSGITEEAKCNAEGAGSQGGSTEKPGSSTVEVTSISVPSTASKTVYVDDSLTIVPTVLPSNASNKDIKCSVDSDFAGNTGRVQVTSNGTSCSIKGIDPGNVRIKITSSQKSSVSTTVVIEVKKSSSIKVNDITYVQSSIVVYYGRSSSVSPKIMPLNATNSKIVCSVESGNNNISVSTSEDGKSCNIKSLSVGEAKLKITSEDGGASLSLSVFVIPSCTLEQNRDSDICVTTNLSSGISDPSSVTACMWSRNGIKKYTIYQTFYIGYIGAPAFFDDFDNGYKDISANDVKKLCVNIKLGASGKRYKIQSPNIYTELYDKNTYLIAKVTDAGTLEEYKEEYAIKWNNH